MKQVNRAVRDYELISPNDRILVALSGGKDSYGMLWALRELQRAAPFRFDLVGYHLDQGQPGHDPSALDRHFQSLRMKYEIEYQDTYTRVVEKTEAGKTYCSLCSRFRRAILYKAAIRHDCNKVALGHHREDLIETLLMNVFHSGQIKSMPPKLLSEAGTHELIRPLALVPEDDLIQLAQEQEFEIMPCQLCGSQASERDATKKLLAELSKQYPHIKGNILHALTNVTPSHLMDKRWNTYLAAENDHETQPSAPTALVQLGSPGNVM